VLDAPGSRTGRANVTATLDGGLCVVSVTPAASGGFEARPLAISLSDACAVKEDPSQVRPVVASVDGAAIAQTAAAGGAAGGAGAAGAAGAGGAGGGSALPTPVAGGSSLPAEYFAPPPDANLLPPRHPSGSRNSCGCDKAGAKSSRAGGAAALLGLGVLVMRRRRR